jgi:hypothetical protein
MEVGTRSVACRDRGAFRGPVASSHAKTSSAFLLKKSASIIASESASLRNLYSCRPSAASCVELLFDDPAVRKMNMFLVLSKQSTL